MYFDEESDPLLIWLRSARNSGEDLPSSAGINLVDSGLKSVLFSSTLKL
jgi:hypothetical protein